MGRGHSNGGGEASIRSENSRAEGSQTAPADDILYGLTPPRGRLTIQQPQLTNGQLIDCAAIGTDLFPEYLEEVGFDYDHEWCFETSDAIVDYLTAAGVECSRVDGTFAKEHWSHAWVETEDGLIIDATITQFSDEDFPAASDEYADWPRPQGIESLAIVPPDHPYRKYYFAD